MRVFAYDKADQFNTIDVLKRLRVEFPDIPWKVIWDGAPYHWAQRVQVAATTLEVEIEPLPAYSPDFMPVEHLWQWLREEVTYHAGYAKADELKQRVEQFQQQINADPLALADRLWVKNHLDPKKKNSGSQLRRGLKLLEVILIVSKDNLAAAV